MAIFDRKNEKAFEKLVEYYGLEDIKKEDLELISENSSIFASGGINGLFAQNWLMIKQLDRLNKNIEKLLEKNS
ncbi:hypothetical protein [Anaerococcus hydrogenalis]|uniref:Uncharacterized protein n=1 Tax=Anaerococcus hydrogenalis ACS-025-V-Sch4 TaxID=879306 RepID=F0H244_9FIRM|nr:hypothetical protein [Anaerococcus hydrogenalis]EGC83627.1 hypothetical protein HMPREF9246_1404 [Anaerococcus hydrogenalis ACS-025-V-Sch4]